MRTCLNHVIHKTRKTNFSGTDESVLLGFARVLERMWVAPSFGSFACSYAWRFRWFFLEGIAVSKVPSPLRLQSLCFQTALLQVFFRWNILPLCNALFETHKSTEFINSPVLIPLLFECFGLRGGRWVLASQSCSHPFTSPPYSFKSHTLSQQRVRASQLLICDFTPDHWDKATQIKSSSIKKKRSVLSRWFCFRTFSDSRRISVYHNILYMAHMKYTRDNLISLCDCMRTCLNHVIHKTRKTDPSEGHGGNAGAEGTAGQLYEPIEERRKAEGQEIPGR